MAGRPTIYTPELGDVICERLASGESLIGICEDEGMPCESAVRAWALNPEHDIYAKYTRARELQAERMADEIIEIADERTGDKRTLRDGSEVIDNEAIQRSRLRVDTRKWYLSKVLPKKYGERTTVESTVKYDLSNLSTEELEALRAIHAKLGNPAS
jgi:hypothetical protein